MGNEPSLAIGQAVAEVTTCLGSRRKPQWHRAGNPGRRGLGPRDLHQQQSRLRQKLRSTSTEKAKKNRHWHWTRIPCWQAGFGEPCESVRFLAEQPGWMDPQDAKYLCATANSAASLPDIAHQTTLRLRPSLDAKLHLISRAQENLHTADPNVFCG